MLPFLDYGVFMSRPSRKFSVSLPANLAERVETVAAHLGVSRSAAIALLLESSSGPIGDALLKLDVCNPEESERRLRGDSARYLRTLLMEALLQIDQHSLRVHLMEEQGDLFKD